MTKKTVLLFMLALMLTAGVGTPTFARNGADEPDTSTSQHDDSDEKEVEAENEVEDSDDDGLHRSKHLKQLNDRIALKRAEIEKKFEAKKEESKARLEGKRLETCEKREVKINELIQSSSEKAGKKLAVFQKIEAGVQAFYEKKGLSAEGYNAAVANADEKEASAIAAIDAMTGLTYSCDDVDGTKPGQIVASAVQIRRDALKDYKSAVRELIVLVKQALEASEAVEAATDQTNTTLEQES